MEQFQKIWLLFEKTYWNMQYFQAQDSGLKMSYLEPNLFPKSEEAQFTSLTSFTKALAPRLLGIKIRICTVAYSSLYPATRRSRPAWWLLWSPLWIYCIVHYMPLYVHYMPFASHIVLCAYSLILVVFVTGSEKLSENNFFLWLLVWFCICIFL